MTWAPDYATVAGLKSYLHISDTTDDTFLALWVTTASRNIDDYCGRQFGKVAALESRTYTAVWDRHLGCYVTEIDDVQDVTDLAIVDENADEITDYDFDPVNALKKGKPYERVMTSTGGVLTIDAIWGWTAVPSGVATGLYLQASRLAARRDSPFGIAGSPSEGNEMRLLAQLDPDFRTALKPLRRNWWAA